MVVQDAGFLEPKQNEDEPDYISGPLVKKKIITMLFINIFIAHVVVYML